MSAVLPGGVGPQGTPARAQALARLVGLARLRANHALSTATGLPTASRVVDLDQGR